MKVIKVFAVFLMIHLLGWSAAHLYLGQNPKEVLLVVDTSYSMKPKFPEIEQWIDNYSANSRYQTIRVGTDKAILGNLDELKSRSIIFRTAFGRITEGSFAQYMNIRADERILLSDGVIKPDGWEVVVF